MSWKELFGISFASLILTGIISALWTNVCVRWIMKGHDPIAEWWSGLSDKIDAWQIAKQEAFEFKQQLRRMTPEELGEFQYQCELIREGYEGFDPLKFAREFSRMTSAERLTSRIDWEILFKRDLTISRAELALAHHGSHPSRHLRPLKRVVDHL